MKRAGSRSHSHSMKIFLDVRMDTYAFMASVFSQPPSDALPPTDTRGTLGAGGSRGTLNRMEKRVPGRPRPKSKVNRIGVPCRYLSGWEGEKWFPMHRGIWKACSWRCPLPVSAMS